MSQKNLVQPISIVVIIACVLASGYILLKPNTANQTQNQDISGLAPMVDGKQVIKTTVMAVSYSPASFKVRAGVPVRFEATSSGQPGCGAGNIVSKLFSGGSLYLDPTAGKVAVNEFTPKTPGKYAFTCPMGMIKGTIEVISADTSSNPKGASVVLAATADQVIPSGSGSCGCGGGNTCGAR